MLATGLDPVCSLDAFMIHKRRPHGSEGDRPNENMRPKEWTQGRGSGIDIFYGRLS